MKEGEQAAGAQTSAELVRGDVDESPWELREEIGHGAVAVVHRVVERASGRVFAGKLLHERHARDPGAMARFGLEVTLASTLVHPSIVRVYGAYEIAGRPALVMELVEGCSLSALLADEETLEPLRVMQLVRDIAEGLAVAHGVGVIHRDLKPANILVSKPGTEVEQLKIADFGMARASALAGTDRRALTVLGTPEYMAPECLDPIAVDTRTDLYALGCIAFELATGSPPYGGATSFAILEAHRRAPIPALPESYPSAFRALVRSLLAKRSGERPQSARTVADRIEALLERDADGAAISRIQQQLALVGSEGRCAACREVLVARVPVCFVCGLPRAVAEAGHSCVIITGPGGATEKLHFSLRDQLLRWIAENPTLSIDATRLGAATPRLPFVFVSGVSEPSANDIIAALGSLGILAHVSSGAGYGDSEVFNKATIMAGRVIAPVVAISAAPLFINPFLILVTLPIGLVLGVTVAAVEGLRSYRSVAQRSEAAPDVKLPSGLLALVRSLRTVVPVVRQRRHRDALGELTQRVLVLWDELSADLPSDGDHALESELVVALSTAMTATQHIDALEAAVLRPDFDPTDARHHAKMRERDAWAARLLGLSAALDSLAMRHALAKASKDKTAARRLLEDLRVQISALEDASSEI